MDTALSPSGFVAYRPIFQFFGRVFRLETPSGAPLLEVRMKLFRLREEIVGYADAARTEPRIRINARSILDFGATYDVTDAVTGERLGAWRRKGLRSLLRDTWTLLDASDAEIGTLEEESMGLALVRRFLLNLIPQTFNLTLHGNPAGSIAQRFSLLRRVYDVNLRLDPRMAQAMAVLILAIEGRQQ